MKFAYLTVNSPCQGRRGMGVRREGGRIVAAMERGAFPFPRARLSCRLYKDKKNGVLKSETRIN
jgi:hypothetical protein